MMAKKQYVINIPSMTPHTFPRVSQRGMKLSARVNEEGGVDLVGNRAGMLYLARHLIYLAFHPSKEGMHIHLDTLCHGLEAGSVEVALYNTDLLKNSAPRLPVSLDSELEET